MLLYLMVVWQHRRVCHRYASNASLMSLDGGATTRVYIKLNQPRFKTTHTPPVSDITNYFF
jgi:hypothetical protein